MIIQFYELPNISLFFPIYAAGFHVNHYLMLSLHPMFMLAGGDTEGGNVVGPGASRGACDPESGGHHYRRPRALEKPIHYVLNDDVYFTV